ncbi:styrene monooxygenase/indole monooxygenase family protein [Paenibacillus mucilaginosus]|uniref:Putative styrene monooxygenase n=1 Tax=Paenibacillus mucilaginosus (strain KNP414) TaxID=1036673 RepID=F8FGA8_PAEMK|nr:styrene monooxygenase/indole monooxygenase family protein [Paenibacillus mucilaginosus]AEI43928.1 putative styrene monooxygenase [Paenibacillus mucilaginosus KNP414]MCG7212570.1 styrene monooxygenase [Paenibacillus mucilaginosus]WDM25401.1 styrene monooxygenase [Paenibacillus mucilaginosus]
MKRIAVLGSGTAGLHLSYALVSRGPFEVTVYTDRSPEEVRSCRVSSTQVHFGPARAREAAYGMPAWEQGPDLESIHVTVGGQKLFTGRLESPAKSVDQRAYFARCMEDLEAKGVSFVYGRVDEERLQELAPAYDLLVDCSGKRGPLAPFPQLEELSPVPAPQRKCSVGYFHGVAPLEPSGVSISILPGAGELFEIPALTAQGPVTILFIEAVPGGPLDAFGGIKTAESFRDRMRAVVDSHFPAVAARLDGERFGLCDERGFVQIAVQPSVHRPYCTVGSTLVLGCGDSVVLNDPITGQGCNTASYCAEQLVLTLAEEPGRPWDEQTGEAYWRRIRDHVTEVTTWTNAMMGPLPDHAVGLLMAGAGDPSTADRIAGWFADPRTAYDDLFRAAAGT